MTIHMYIIPQYICNQVSIDEWMDGVYIKRMTYISDMCSTAWTALCYFSRVNTVSQSLLCSRVLSLLTLYSMIVDLNVSIYVAALRDIFLIVWMKNITTLMF